MSAETLLIATSNFHKLVEIQSFLQGLEWRVAGLDEFPHCPAPAETGATFEENAAIKARAYTTRFHVACVADDSGLVVDALSGAPGVRSSRYAGDDASDSDNNAKLLRALNDVADPKRAARFICCCALILPGREIRIETGTVEGRIAREPRGENGFGYDPLFIPDGYDKTFGELDPSIKSGISHRAQAFRKLRAYLEDMQP